MIGIYRIVSPSGKVYVGQSINIEKRWKEYYKLRCKTQPKLYSSLIKYGANSHIFEVLEECLVEELDDKEVQYGNLYEVLVRGLNHCLGYQKQLRSQEVYQKISEANKGKIPWNKGKVVGPRSKESIEKQLTTRGTWQHTQKVKEQISRTKQERGILPPSQKNTVWITNEIVNKRWPLGEPLPEQFRKGQVRSK